ncbi:hypothetical protein BOTBODRAFT_189158 [Botryobasidium botryosum FD-172 SS1]|uniref:Arf-GAP domain-containing protein n=1 Tax=Botryobasidium botryosum (strain FD-172 SS1) TaxID=930990 RepID=A0A067MLH4_BOTB1|nr:hypothetical protein BOTBODRAFT_189158 [Botryobasidium botryosum FD-172 SS1]
MSAVSKAAADRHQRMLLELVAQPGNDVCADCKARAPRWSSWNLGIFICVQCASIHRKIGTHITKVKSLTLDTWSKEQLESVKQIGNIKANAFYNPNEQRNPPPTNFNESERHSDMEKYIRAKYQHKKFMDPETAARAAAGALPSDDVSKPSPTLAFAGAQHAPPSRAWSTPIPSTSTAAASPPAPLPPPKPSNAMEAASQPRPATVIPSAPPPQPQATFPPPQSQTTFSPPQPQAAFSSSQTTSPTGLLWDDLAALSLSSPPIAQNTQPNSNFAASSPFHNLGSQPAPTRSFSMNYTQSSSPFSTPGGMQQTGGMGAFAPPNPFHQLQQQQQHQGFAPLAGGTPFGQPNAHMFSSNPQPQTTPFGMSGMGTGMSPFQQQQHQPQIQNQTPNFANPMSTSPFHAAQQYQPMQTNPSPFQQQQQHSLMHNAQTPPPFRHSPSPFGGMQPQLQQQQQQPFQQQQPAGISGAAFAQSMLPQRMNSQGHPSSTNPFARQDSGLGGFGAGGPPVWR